MGQAEAAVQAVVGQAEAAVQAVVVGADNATEVGLPQVAAG